MRPWQRLKYVHLRLVTFDWQVLTNYFQQSANKRIFCMFGGTISEDWSRFVLITGGTKKRHFWMRMIAETFGEFLKGDRGRSRLITGGNISGHYCKTERYFFPCFMEEVLTKALRKCRSCKTASPYCGPLGWNSVEHCKHLTCGHYSLPFKTNWPCLKWYWGQWHYLQSIFKSAILRKMCKAR